MKDISVERHYDCDNLLDLVQFWDLDLDWKTLLTEARTCYGLWNSCIKPKTGGVGGSAGADEEWDMSMSKNAYNIITLSSTLPEMYKLWNQMFKNIRSHSELKTKPLWIHAWMNVHRSEELGKMSLGWHNHSYCKYHGFVHLSDKATETVFSEYVPDDEKQRDEKTEWYLSAEDRTRHPLDVSPETLVVENKQGLQYLGPGPLMHKVRSNDYDGLRVSIGYDVIDDLHWMPMEHCSSETGTCQVYPVFSRQEDFFNTKLVPIPTYEESTR
jgi:hypothetical protein|tara:strand:+ start:999 stop:1808 length:810 start_codon:yes stop_codon:yes gene_type:complete